MSLLIVSPQKNGDKDVPGGPMVKNLPSPAAWLEIGELSSLHSGQRANDLSTKQISVMLKKKNNNLPSSVGDPGSIPGRIAKVPHAMEQQSSRPTNTET